MSTLATIVSAADMSADITGTTYNPAGDRFVIQMVATGSPVGSLRVQGSLDGTNWSDLSFIDEKGQSHLAIAISAAYNDLALVDVPGIGFVRVTWTFSSGTGVLNAYIRERP